jgi:hypothetical protein
LKAKAIFHVPVDLGGHASGLAAAERRLGLDSQCVSLYPATHSTEPVDVRIGRTPWEREGQRTRLLLEAIRSADEVHYHFGETLLMPRRHPTFLAGKQSGVAELAIRALASVLWGGDVAILGLRKKLAFHFYGDDIRQREYSLCNYEISIASEVDENYYPAHAEVWKRRMIGMADRWGTAIFAYNPDLMNLLPSRAIFLPYTHINPPNVSVQRNDNPAVRVVHAPTHRSAKGTRHVVAACEFLKREGLSIDLKVLENVNHHEARDEIAQADVFVDQLLAGWYGGAALEAMAAAVPTVAYIREQDLRHVPQDMAASLPIVRATPTTITETLRKVCRLPRDERRQIGDRSRKFALRFHDVTATAERVSRAMGRRLEVHNLEL